MNLLNRLLELITKSAILHKKLFFIHSKPDFKIFNIDRTQTEISYLCKSGNKIFSRHVKDFFSKDYLILHFDSSDAARIGYLYGIWLQSN